MAPSTITVSQKAFTTVLLHCAKYPASAVTGVLVGRVQGQTVEVVHAVPLQHHWTQLSPMVEAGLGLISAHLSSASSSSGSLSIVGVYYAPAEVKKASAKFDLEQTPLKMAQGIAKKLGKEAVALQVNNEELANVQGGHTLSGFVVADGATQAKALTAKEAVKVGDGEATALTHARSEVVNGAWESLVDFDDHLEDTHRDWLTPVLA